MKDKYGETSVYKFTRLKSKMYSIRDINKKEKSVYKGHSSDIKYDDFKNTHSNKKFIRHDISGIKSKHHEIYTMKVIEHLYLI